MEEFKMKKVLIFLLLSISFTAISSTWENKKAPFFDLPDQHGTFRNLNDFGNKWLVLYFYPKNDTPGCTTEAKNFTSDLDKFTKLGAQIVGVSVDDIASHKDFAKKYSINFPLLADKDMVMSEEYGVLKKIPMFSHASRQTFVIDPKGYIAKHYESVKPSKHSKEVYDFLNQFIKENQD